MGACLRPIRHPELLGSSNVFIKIGERHSTLLLLARLWRFTVGISLEISISRNKRRLFHSTKNGISAGAGASRPKRLTARRDTVAARGLSLKSSTAVLMAFFLRESASFEQRLTEITSCSPHIPMH